MRALIGRVLLWFIRPELMKALRDERADADEIVQSGTEALRGFRHEMERLNATIAALMQRGGA